MSGSNKNEHPDNSKQPKKSYSALKEKIEGKIIDIYSGFHVCGNKILEVKKLIDEFPSDEENP